MWIKNLFNDQIVNLNNAAYVKTADLAVGKSDYSVYVIMNNVDRHILFAGTKEQCQAYMTELEKELKAYGKLISVEVKPEIKCTCGNDGKPVWEHAVNCPVYAPF